MLSQPKLCPIPLYGRYELLEEYDITIEGYRIVVPATFTYDGATIHPIAWQVIYSPFNPLMMTPALIHDWLFLNHQLPRKTVNEVFYYLLRDNGVPYWKAKAMQTAVSLPGKRFWKPKPYRAMFMKNLAHKLKGTERFPLYHLQAYLDGTIVTR